jgi:hypothetical protein
MDIVPLLVVPGMLLAFCVCACFCGKDEEDS